MSEKAGNNIKPFEELTIKDDFMFGAVMSEEKNLKPLLEYILDIKIDHITYPERQKTISANYGYKSVRLDVYCEDDNNTVYNIEIQVANRKDLAKRIRYYHDMIDINILEQGRKVSELKKSIVIFICDFDYYGKNRYMYTFKGQCQEDSSVYLDDDTLSVVLYINGSVGEINEELKATLQYMAGNTPPKGSYADNLDQAVKKVKINEKWRRDYMTMAMKIDEERDIAELKKAVSAVRKGRELVSDDVMMSMLSITREELDTIYRMIDNHPEMSDWDIAKEILFGIE